MRERNYWDRFQRNRISRRRLLGSTAALGAGAAGVALLGCGGGDDGDGDEPDGGADQQEGNQPVGTRGGIYRYYGFDALALDTMDPLQTQFGPIYSMHSAVFSKILKYDDDVEQTMSADLAEAMPENPEGTEIIVKLRDNVFFHDTPQAQANFPTVAGRKLTADDVKYSIDRQISEDSALRDLYYRKGQWQTVERVEVVDPLTVRFVLKAPTAPFMHFLADRNAFIIAQDLVDEGDQMNEATRMIGTGPFFLDHFATADVVRVRRNPNWFAKDDMPELGADRPFLEGYDALWTPQDDAAQEPALRQKQVDSTGFNDDNTTARVEQAEANVILSEEGIGGRIGIRLLVDRPPWNDPRLRRALHLALNRSTLGQQMFPAAPGRVGFFPSGPVAWCITRWALPREELNGLPGYRYTDPAQREEDEQEARQLWQAANGPTSFSGHGANIPSYIPNKGKPEIIREVSEVLGLNLTMADAQYVELAQRLLRNQQDAPDGTAFTFGYDNGWIDLDDWLYPYFKSAGPKNSFRLSDPELDSMLEEQRQAFDYEERREIGYRIQRYYIQEANDGMGVHADLPIINGINRSLRWNYVKNDFSATWFGSNYLFANTWLDQEADTFRGRSA